MYKKNDIVYCITFPQDNIIVGVVDFIDYDGRINVNKLKPNVKWFVGGVPIDEFKDVFTKLPKTWDCFDNKHELTHSENTFSCTIKDKAKIEQGLKAGLLKIAEYSDFPQLSTEVTDKNWKTIVKYKYENREINEWFYPRDVFVSYELAKEELDKRLNRQTEISKMSDEELDWLEINSLIKKLSVSSQKEVIEYCKSLEDITIYDFRVFDGYFQRKKFRTGRYYENIIEITYNDEIEKGLEHLREIKAKKEKYYCYVEDLNTDGHRKTIKSDYVDDFDEYWNYKPKNIHEVINIVNRNWTIENGLIEPESYHSHYNGGFVEVYNFEHGIFTIYDNKLCMVQINLPNNTNIYNNYKGSCGRILISKSYNSIKNNFDSRDILSKAYKDLYNIVGDKLIDLFTEYFYLMNTTGCHYQQSFSYFDVYYDSKVEGSYCKDWDLLQNSYKI